MFRLIYLGRADWKYMKSAKHKIDTIIKQYKEFFKDEYSDFIEGAKAREKDKFADVKDGGDIVERAMWDMPETLYNLIIRKLEPQELEWLNKKGKGGGQHYIVKKHKEFRVPEKI